MISYEPNYEVGNKPYICKVFTASNGEELHTQLNFSNEKEREEFSSDLIYQHMDNLLQYIRDESQSLSMIPLDEPIGNNAFSIKNWEKIEWAQREIYYWWNYIYFHPESPANNPPVIEHEEHEGDGEPHTHHPETGEVIYITSDSEPVAEGDPA